MYIALITITLRPSILDPQGKASLHALENLDFTQIDKVRIGKHIEMWIEATTLKEATLVAKKACDQLLANPVMEDYTVSVEAIEKANA